MIQNIVFENKSKTKIELNTSLESISSHKTRILIKEDGQLVFHMLQHIAHSSFG